MSQKIVLLDNSYFNFYRYFATSKWWKFRSKLKGTVEVPEFMESLDSQYLKNLTKLSKLTGVNIADFYCIRDSDRSTIWRNEIYGGYKSDRQVDTTGTLCQIFRHLNGKFESYFKHVIRLDRLEADDIIAVTTKIFSELGHEVTVISGDADFVQLLDYPGVKLLDASGKEKRVKDPRGYLRKKIIGGDPSDNIGPCKYPWTNASDNLPSDFALGFLINSVLIDFDYIPRVYQNLIVVELCRQGIIDIRELDQDYNPKDIQLGLCCINTQLEDCCCSKKPIMATIEKKGINYLYGIVEQNMRDLIRMIEWNHANGLRVLRISSGLVPHKSNKRVDFGSMNRFQPLFDEIGVTARRYKQRLTFHPGQYNVVGSPNVEAYENTILDLDYHAEVLDRIGCDQDGVMVVHGGGLYGESKETNYDRWVKGFDRLPERVRRRLVLENDEKSYNIEDCLRISDRTGIPVVFDTHHHECYIKTHPDETLKPGGEYIKQILSTWGIIKPKFHVSEQGPGKCGHHSDYIETIPDYLLEIPEKYDTCIDIMIEAKAKERAIMKLYEKYDALNPFLVENDCNVPK